MPLTEGTVLITGVTGLVGSAIALEIERAGFKVRATTRDLEKGTAWSSKYPDLNVEWVLIQDQKDLGVYDDAMKGCVGAIHAAGPFVLDHTAGEDIMNPQINGTLSILQAAAKEKSVKRVVYTSTVAAIQNAPHLGNNAGTTYDESFWNEGDWEQGLGSEDIAHNPVTSYGCGKTLAEQKAWEFMKTEKPHFDLVALCPGTGYGPITQACDSLKDLDTASERLWEHIINAHNEVHPGPLNYINDPSPIFTNTLDTAEAHLKALTWPGLGGQRYLLISGYYSYTRIIAILKKAFPEEAYRFPDVPDEGLPIEPWYFVDCSKAVKDLGWRPRTLDESIIAEGTTLFELAKKEKMTNGVAK
ncbi:NAD(P)-binding protein [Meredithblackwellia eburnea MCA 4105]